MTADQDSSSSEQKTTQETNQEPLRGSTSPAGQAEGQAAEQAAEQAQSEEPTPNQTGYGRFPRYKISSSQLFQHSLPKRAALVIIGSFIMALSMNLLIEPGGILPGGFVGLTKLIQRILVRYWGIEVPYTVLNVSFNLIPALYAFFNVGKRFVILSFLSIAVSSFLIDLLPVYSLTQDMFLIAIFAGLINGVGLSIILNADASAGGTDFIAMALSNKYNVATWNYFLIFNALILGISAYFFSVDKALYSIIMQFISTQVVNQGHLRYQRRTAFIITSDPEPLAKELMKITHHGVTSFQGIGCYSGKEQYMLYMVVGRKDIRKIKAYLKTQTPQVFLNVTDSEQLGGNFYVEPMN